jgi:hypothetical protein
MEMRLMKRLATYAAVAYLGAGVAMGSLLYYSMPAMNVMGWGYYAVTWPWFVCAGTKHCKSAYVPPWAFTFRS